jgi:transcriptional regulator with XRE-family HTH domain
MSFGENLKNVRKQRDITQEELAETLGVSRQAISKWESDNGYPETEKLLLLSKILNISLDYLMNDASEMQEKEKSEEKNIVIAPSGKIAIMTHDKQNVIVCHSVKSSKIIFPHKDEPEYILLGIDKVTFWGEHTTILGWYETLENIEKEIREIVGAINNGDGTYSLKYNAEIELGGFFDSPKIKK